MHKIVKYVYFSKTLYMKASSVAKFCSMLKDFNIFIHHYYNIYADKKGI